MNTLRRINTLKPQKEVGLNLCYAFPSKFSTALPEHKIFKRGFVILLAK